MPVPAKFDANVQITPLNAPEKFGNDVQVTPIEQASAPILTSTPSIARTAYNALTQRQEPGMYFNPPESDTSYKASAEQMVDGLLTTVHNVGGRAIAGVGSMVRHPLDTIKGSGAMLKDVAFDEPLEAFGGPKANGPIEQRVAEFKTEYARNPREAIENAAGDVLGLYASGKLTDLAGGVIPGLKVRALDKLRTGTQTMVGAGTRAVKSAVSKAADVANDAAEKVTAKNTEAQVAHQQDVRDTRAKNVKALQEHLGEVDETAKGNQAGPAIVDARQGLEALQRKVSQDLEKRHAEAKKSAKQEADDRYDKQRELLNNETIPDSGEKGALNGNNISARAVTAWEDSITGTEGTYPSIVKSLFDRVNSKEPLTWRDLQGYRTEIGKKLSTGRLPGDEYQGYRNMLEVVDDGLQKIADAHGMGDQVRSDRAFYRRYMEAFHDTGSEPNTMARKSLTKTTPEYASEQAEQARRAALGKFDPQIPKLSQSLDSVRSRLDALPPDTTARGMTKPYPEPPVPGKPAPLQQTPIDVPEVDPRKIRNDLVERWAHGEEKLNTWQVRSLIRGSLGPALGVLLGEASRTGFGGVMIGAAVGGAFGPALIAKLVDMPAVREFLTRPPAGELEGLQQVPHADRIKIVNGLNEVVKAAAAKGEPIKVSPAIAALLASGSPEIKGAATQKLEAIRNQYTQ